MTVGVVIPCHRHERFLPRTLAALERALEGRDWRGALVVASHDGDALPALSERWQVIVPREASPRPLTPGAARMVGFDACGGDWVLFVDADVEVDAEWVKAALAIVARHPELGGLWGRLEEWFVDGSSERPGSPDMYGVGDRECPTAYMATFACYRRAALLAAGGYDPLLGARPMKRTLARYVEAPLAEMVLRGELEAGDVARVTTDDDKIVIDVVKKNAA